MLSLINKKLLCYIIGLARAIDGNMDLITNDTIFTLYDSILALPILDNDSNECIDRIESERKRLIPNCYICQSSCGRNDLYNINEFNSYSEEIKSIKLSILLNIIDKVSVNYYNSNYDFVKLILNSLFYIGFNDATYEELNEYNNKLNSI